MPCSWLVGAVPQQIGEFIDLYQLGSMLSAVPVVILSVCCHSSVLLSLFLVSIGAGWTGPQPPAMEEPPLVPVKSEAHEWG